MPDNKKLTITRVYDAPRDMVFNAWMDPELVAQWWGPNGFTMPICEIEPKVGGKIYMVMEDSAGLIKKGSRYPMTGEFTEIDEPNKIVYTSAAIMNDKPMFDNIVTVTFEEEDGKTKMTVHIVVDNVQPGAEMALAGMEMGWNQQLDKLRDFLSK